MLIAVMLVAALIGCEKAVHTPEPSGEMWNADLSVSRTRDNSPSGLYVSWNPVGEGEVILHYVITAVEAGGTAPIVTTSIDSGIDAKISGLKPNTAYTISLKACKDEDCSRYLSADSTAAGKTP